MIKFFFRVLPFIVLQTTTLLAADVDPINFGAVPTDGKDDSVAIQAALNALQSGERLVFQPGVYQHNQQLFLSKTDVEVEGQGAVLYSTDPTKAAFTVQDSANVTIRALDFLGSGTARLTTDRSCGILVYRTNGLRLLSNFVHGQAGAGIMLQQTGNFVIQGNVVMYTLADAIHITNRSYDGQVYFNMTAGSGDDGIALVGYFKNGGRVHGVDIAGNSVLGNTHGRGITVEGAYDVWVDNNYIENTSAAGILLISSGANTYNTYGVDDVMITRNTVVAANYQTSIVHGGVLMSARTGTLLEDGVEIPNTVTNVVFQDNSIINPIGASAHVRISNFTSNIQILDNTLIDADSSHSPWIFYGPPAVRSGNTYNGVDIQ